MSDRTAWLAKTVEEALDPDLEICDAHHHLWNRGGHCYLVDDLLGDISGHRVTKTVYVECQSMYRTEGPEALRPVGETEFIDRITSIGNSQTDDARVAAGIVGFAELSLGAAVGEVLNAHLKASSRFRGIRYATAWDASDKVHNAHTKPRQYLMADPTFREGFACLGDLGLTFDAWLYFHQIPELTDLARAFPETTIMLNHVGGPIGIGPYADGREDVFAVWRQNIRELARCGNVAVKLGGLTMTMAGFAWHKRDRPAGSTELAEGMSPYYHACIDDFGPERCMFESNFPVDGTGTTYTVLWNAFKQMTRDFSPHERRALFHDTAARIYGLDS